MHGDYRSPRVFPSCDIDPLSPEDWLSWELCFLSFLLFLLRSVNQAPPSPCCCDTESEPMLAVFTYLYIALGERSVKSVWREFLGNIFIPLMQHLVLKTACLGALNLKVRLVQFTAELGVLENNSSLFLFSRWQSSTWLYPMAREAYDMQEMLAIAQNAWI